MRNQVVMIVSYTSRGHGYAVIASLFLSRASGEIVA